MKKNIQLIIILFISKLTFGQTDSIKEKAKDKANYITRYWQFLQKDSTQKNTFILASYNFMFTNLSQITHGGRGTYIGIGFNVARLFSKRMVLGIGFEKKAWKGLIPSRLNSGFVQDFNAEYQNNLSVVEDSVRGAVLKQCINGSDRYERRGTFYGVYSISFSPFPDQYGGFMLIAKKGWFGIPVHGTFGTVFNPHGTDWVAISAPIDFNFELVFKPFTFFKRTSTYFLRREFQISFFYERINWKRADFDGLPLSSVMSTTFMNKYSIQDHFGFSIKIGRY